MNAPGNDLRRGRTASVVVLSMMATALVGGKYLGMPEWRKVPSETLRASAVKTGSPSIRVFDDMRQWGEIRKGIKDRGVRVRRFRCSAAPATLPCP